MVGLASAGSPVQDSVASDDGLHALLRWRLADPAWTPSFPDLLDDVRTCIDPDARPARVLAALAATVRAEPTLGDRARAVADEARRLIVAGHALDQPRTDAAVPRAPAPVQVIGGFRP